jgi:replicative DNA helicase
LVFNISHRHRGRITSFSGDIMPKTNKKEVLSSKIPPQSLETEMAVLGAMLLDREAVDSAVEILAADDFYKEAHSKIFQAIINLYDRNEPADLVTLTEELKKREWLEDVGGAVYLTSLMDSVPSSANLEFYAKIVKEKALLRQLIAVSTGIVSDSFNEPEQVNEFLDEAERAIFNITQGNFQEDFIRIKNLIHSSIETAEEMYKNKKLVTGVPTGFLDFDEKTSGLQKGELIIVAGRPSTGKTSFALNLAANAAIKEKIPVGIFSLEMSKEQLVQRLLCSEGKVNLHKLRTGWLSESAFSRLAMGAGSLSEAPIFIDDSVNISVLELRAKARRLQSKENIKLILIDYLQLMQGRSRVESRQQEISEISRSLKGLAKELNVPVVAISQLSREVEKRGDDARPKLSDLRESGAIEQDADLVAFIYRKLKIRELDSDEESRSAEIIIGKQRNGPIGTVKVAFLPEYTAFENVSTRKDESDDHNI